MDCLSEYHNSILDVGLEATWKIILNNYFPNDFFKPETLGGLYEDGLAFANKIEKKSMGKYYTPIDVANVMSSYLLELPGENICDLCCGTGNLIISVLESIGDAQAREKLKNGNIYLYDIDDIAMSICKAIIENKYGDCANNLHLIHQDCLDPNLHFPKNAKVISNPPYGKQDSLKNTSYSCGKKTKELYVAFMEKIINEQVPGVIITPHSFLGGTTFKILRKEMGDGGGKIFAFDNVPGNIFKGKKFGIFNSNEANSTRAAITVFNPSLKEKGYQIAQFIRFKTDEREQILNCDFLNSLLPNAYQKGTGDIFYRLEKGTENISSYWLQQKRFLKDLISNTPTNYKLDIPNTCRYFTTASVKELKRTGKIILYFKDEESLYLAYAFINSSLCYYYHRMCNGGITYPKTLLVSMPVFGSVTAELKDFCNQMISEEEKYIVRKKNAGTFQENIKFPIEYRNILNQLILNQVNISTDNLLKVHKNSCLDETINNEE